MRGLDASLCIFNIIFSIMHFTYEEFSFASFHNLLYKHTTDEVYKIKLELKLLAFILLVKRINFLL